MIVCRFASAAIDLKSGSGSLRRPGPLVVKKRAWRYGAPQTRRKILFWHVIARGQHPHRQARSHRADLYHTASAPPPSHRDLRCRRHRPVSARLNELPNSECSSRSASISTQTSPSGATMREVQMNNQGRLMDLGCYRGFPMHRRNPAGVRSADPTPTQRSARAPKGHPQARRNKEGIKDRDATRRPAKRKVSKTSPPVWRM